MGAAGRRHLFERISNRDRRGRRVHRGGRPRIRRPDGRGRWVRHPGERPARAIDAQLSRLVASGKILRIKIWAPDGTVAFSDLAALRGRQVPVGAELDEALQGNVATDFSNGTDEENVFERGLAQRFLSI